MARKHTRQQIQRAARAIWNDANQSLFYGCLPMTRICVANLGEMGWYGYQHFCRDNAHKIVIDSTTHWTRGTLTYVMIHEMIHSLQRMAKSERTSVSEIHGRFFQYHHNRIFGCRYVTGQIYDIRFQ